MGLSLNMLQSVRLKPLGCLFRVAIGRAVVNLNNLIQNCVLEPARTLPWLLEKS
jgi:hypothetical protein